MANILSLAAKINADASGFKLDPVEKALRRLGEETDKVSGIFDKFTATSEAAAKAQADTSKALQDLIAARRAGTVSADEFAKAFESIRDAATAEAAALQRAAQITEANLSPLQRYDAALAELDAQLQAGRISQETYTRATAGAAKGLNDAERAALGFAVQQKQIENAAGNTTLKFNELSGVFSALPGPLGNIAGRISGLSSASEGLSRTFSGGLRAGIGNVASSLSGLANPLTVALVGVTGFAAGASAIVRGLIDLEARVKGLGAAADQLGVSFETIQVLEESATRAGTSLEAATSGIQKFAVRIDDARKGTGAAAEAFRELGISQQELASTAPTELAGRVAQELAKIEDPARRAALQVDLLGKSGDELRRVFSAIPDAAADLELFGGAISEEDRARIEALGPAFDGFGVALRGLGQSVLTPFAGIVTGLTKTLSGVINVVTSVAQAFGSVLGPVLNEFGALFGGIGDGINAVIGYLRSFFGTTEQATQEAAQLQAITEKATQLDSRPALEYQKAVDGIRVSLTEAFKESVKFGEQGLNAARLYSATVADLQQQFERGIINEDSFRGAIERANTAYETQIAQVRRVAEEAERKAQAEQDAVNRIIESNLRAIQVQQQFRGDTPRADAAENLLRINDEFERTELKIREARAAGDQATVDALTARLAVLDQVAGREEDIATGALAARQAEAQAIADAAARREQLDNEARQRRLQAEQEAERQIAAERQRANQFVDQQVALAAFGGNQQRLDASLRVAEIEREIVRVQEAVQVARAAGNQQAIDAGVARIAQLDQVAAKERDIANGRAELEQKIQAQREQAIQAQQQASQQQQEAAKQQQQAAQQQAEAQRKAFEEQARIAAAEAERQQKRIAALNSVGQQTIQGGDIRSQEGARAFLSAAAGAFDPNLAELRAQTKLLRQIFLNSGALQYLERGIGTSVAILGGGA